MARFWTVLKFSRGVSRFSLTRYWKASVNWKSERTCAPFSIPQSFSTALWSGLLSSVSTVFKLGAWVQRDYGPSKIEFRRISQPPPQCSWLPLGAGKCQQIRVSRTFSSWRPEPRKLGVVCPHLELRRIMCPLQGVYLDIHNHIFRWSKQLPTFSRSLQRNISGAYRPTNCYSPILKNVFLCS